MSYDPWLKDQLFKASPFLGLIALLVLMVALLTCGCATVKPCPPCPPVEIVTIQVPGPVVPCPAPPTITPPQLWLLNLSASSATIQEIATALEHDRQELIRVLAEYVAALAVYRTP